ncbi:MAG: HAD family hydrolase [Myxococcota bacterium]
MTRRARYDLVAFDLDGTLVAHYEPIWKTFHERLGSDRTRRKAVIADAVAGRISYEEWFAADLEMLRAAGARRDDLEAVAAGLEAAPGAPDLVRDLQRAGARVAVLSGGADLVLEAVLPGLAFDAVHINRIHFADDGHIVGGRHTAYDMEHKATGLRELCARFGVPMERTAFVGDGANDVEAAREAGFSVAWGDAAPDALREAAHAFVEGPHLDALRPHLFE